MLEQSKAVISKYQNEKDVQKNYVKLGKKITDELSIPTIGIGGGKFTDGHVLVMHDALGMHPNKIPPFATKFVDMYSVGVQGVKKYIESVKARM